MEYLIVLIQAFTILLIYLDIQIDIYIKYVAEVGNSNKIKNSRKGIYLKKKKKWK